MWSHTDRSWTWRKWDSGPGQTNDDVTLTFTQIRMDFLKLSQQLDYTVGRSRDLRKQRFMLALLFSLQVLVPAPPPDGSITQHLHLWSVSLIPGNTVWPGAALTGNTGILGALGTMGILGALGTMAPLGIFGILGALGVLGILGTPVFSVLQVGNTGNAVNARICSGCTVTYSYAKS